MPHFDTNPLAGIALQPGAAEAVLDLRGQARDVAMQQVETLLDTPGFADSYSILFDPPLGDGSETLFQPLGRLFLEARRRGVLRSCLPLHDGAGYYIAFKRGDP